MDRREFSGAGVSGLALVLFHGPASALSLGDLTDQEASQGLKTALEQGALAAVGLLGKPDGFLGDAKVRIPLPGFLEDASKLLKTLGQGKRVDELVTSMNRAAEAAVPLARDLLVQAVRSMDVRDAKRILTGGDTGATDFFAEKTRAPLYDKFLPVVTSATQKVGLAEKYNRVAGKASDMGLVKKDDANIQGYVTRKALDGLFLTIGEQERQLRKDPLGSGSAVLKKVFGALR